MSSAPKTITPTPGQPTRASNQPARAPDQPTRTLGQPARTPDQPARWSIEPVGAGSVEHRAGPKPAAGAGPVGQGPEGSAGLGGRWRWLAFGTVVTAAVMDLLDSTITQVAAPTIRRELGGSYAVIE